MLDYSHPVEYYCQSQPRNYLNLWILNLDHHHLQHSWIFYYENVFIIFLKQTQNLLTKIIMTNYHFPYLLRHDHESVLIILDFFVCRHFFVFHHSFFTICLKKLYLHFYTTKHVSFSFFLTIILSFFPLIVFFFLLT